MSEKQIQEQPDNTQQPKLSRMQALKNDLFFWLQALVAALVLLILLFAFVGRVITVDGTSMFPTLHHKDVLLVHNIRYTPEQGDIIVLTKDFSGYVGQPIVKRVIAVGGQTVRIDYEQGKVFVDGEALNEPYLNEAVMNRPGGSLTIDELTVPEGCVFVLGDNRNHSSDSRHVELGAIDERYILGKAVMIIFPFSNFGTLD